MTSFESAVESLKKKIAASAKTSFGQQVSLANYQDVSVLHAGVDWNENDHPRDPHTGEFIKGLKGYIWGKAAKGGFAGGAGATVVFDLKPGDTLYKTESKAGLIAHADGTFTYHPTVGTHAGKSWSVKPENLAVKDAINGKATLVKSNPGVNLPTNSLVKAKHLLETPDQYAVASDGIAVKKDVLEVKEGSLALKKQMDEPKVEILKQGSGAHKAGKAWDLKIDGVHQGTFETKQQAQDYADSKQVAPKEQKPLGKTIHPSLYGSIPFKPGKTAYTAKQIADYQKDNAGVSIGGDKDGNQIVSGDWVEYDGKPWQVFASPYGAPKVTAYKWVATKQQASNLPHHDVMDVITLQTLTKISDPTGKPYGVEVAHPNSINAQQVIAKPPVAHGSLMSQAVFGEIPNASVKHKKALEAAKGAYIGVTDGTAMAFDKKGKPIISGSWLEIEGKPVQVHASPNENNVAIAKWVSTKKQASNNTYDFPHDVTKMGVLIEDPTGKDYTSLPPGSIPDEMPPQFQNLQKKPTKKSLLTESLNSASPGAKFTAHKYGDDYSYEKTSTGDWHNGDNDGLFPPEAVAEAFQDDAFTLMEPAPAQSAAELHTALFNAQAGALFKPSKNGDTYVFEKNEIGHWVSQDTGNQHGSSELANAYHDSLSVLEEPETTTDLAEAKAAHEASMQEVKVFQQNLANEMDAALVGAKFTGEASDTKFEYVKNAEGTWDWVGAGPDATQGQVTSTTIADIFLPDDDTSLAEPFDLTVLNGTVTMDDIFLPNVGDKINFGGGGVTAHWTGTDWQTSDTAYTPAGLFDLIAFSEHNMQDVSDGKTHASISVVKASMDKHGVAVLDAPPDSSTDSVSQFNQMDLGDKVTITSPSTGMVLSYIKTPEGMQSANDSNIVANPENVAVAIASGKWVTTFEKAGTQANKVSQFKNMDFGDKVTITSKKYGTVQTYTKVPAGMEHSSGGVATDKAVLDAVQNDGWDATFEKAGADFSPENFTNAVTTKDKGKIHDYALAAPVGSALEFSDDTGEIWQYTKSSNGDWSGVPGTGAHGFSVGPGGMLSLLGSAEPDSFAFAMPGETLDEVVAAKPDTKPDTKDSLHSSMQVGDEVTILSKLTGNEATYTKTLDGFYNKVTGIISSPSALEVTVKSGNWTVTINKPFTTAPFYNAAKNHDVPGIEAELQKAPSGSTLAYTTAGGTSYTFVKQDEGKWKEAHGKLFSLFQASGLAYDVDNATAFSLTLLDGPVEPPLKDDFYKAVTNEDESQIIAVLDAAPVGSTVKYTVGQSGEITLVKQSNGMWDGGMGGNFPSGTHKANAVKADLLNAETWDFIPAGETEDDDLQQWEKDLLQIVDNTTDPVTAEKVKAMQPGDALYSTHSPTGKSYSYTKQDDGTFVSVSLDTGQAAGKSGVAGVSGSELTILDAIKLDGFAFSFNNPKGSTEPPPAPVFDPSAPVTMQSIEVLPVGGSVFHTGTITGVTKEYIKVEEGGLYHWEEAGAPEGTSVTSGYAMAQKVLNSPKNLSFTNPKPAAPAVVSAPEKQEFLVVPDEVEGLPVGTTISEYYKKGDGHLSYEWTKEADNHWSATKHEPDGTSFKTSVVFYDDDLKSLVENTMNFDYTKQAPEAPVLVQSPLAQDEISSLPVGTVIQELGVVNGNDWVYEWEKVKEGVSPWKGTPVKGQSAAQSGIAFSDAEIESLVEANTAGLPLYTYLKKVPGGATVAPAPEPEAAPANQKFVHPVSFEEFELSPDDKVFQHKTTPNAFIVVEAGQTSKPIHFFNQYGKLYKPKATQKNLDTAYTETDDWPGKVNLPVAPTQDDDGNLIYVNPDQETLKDAPEGSTVVESPNASNDNPYATPQTFTKKGVFWDYGTEGSNVAGTFNSPYFTYTLTIHAPEEQIDVVPPVWEQQLSEASVGAKIHGTFPTAPGFKVIVIKTGPNLWKMGDSDETFTDVTLADAIDSGETKNGGVYELHASSAPAPSTKKPAKGAKKGVLPKSYTLDTKEITLQPGESLVYFPSHDQYVKTTYGSGKYNLNIGYYQTGVPASIGTWWLETSNKSMAQVSYAGVIKEMKAKGGSIVATNPAASKTVDIDFEPDLTVFHNQGYADDESYTSAIGYVNSVKSDLLNAAPTNYYGSPLNYVVFPQFGLPEDKKWLNLEVDEKLLVFSKLYEPLGQAVANLTAAGKFKMEKSEKADLTRQKNAMAIGYRISLVSTEMLDPDSEWDDDKFDQEISFLEDKSTKPGTSLGSTFSKTISIGAAVSLLKEADKERKFKATLTGLDFDPYNGTAEEYAAFAHTKGQKYLSALSLDDQKKWVLGQLGAPQYADQDFADEIAAAKANVEVAALSAFLTKDQKHDAASVAKEPVKGVATKLAMAQTYSWTHTDPLGNAEMSVVAENIGPDNWKITSQPKDFNVAPAEYEGTDASVAALVAGALESEVDVQASDNLAYGSMTPQDAVAKLETSLGSEINFLDHATLDAAVASRGAKNTNLIGTASKRRWLRCWAIGDQIGMYNIEFAAVGQYDANHPGNPDNPVGKVAFKALAAKLMEEPWGEDFIHGNGNGNITAWIEENYGTGFIPSSWISMHSRQALQNALAKDVQTTGPALKPPSVSDTAWNLVVNLDEDTDLTDLFEGEVVAGMSPEQVDQFLASDYTVTQQIAPTLLGAVPPHVKKLAVWSAGASDQTHSDVLRAIAAKTKNGDYLTETTPVWISPKGEKFPLAPGSTVFRSSSTGSGGEYFFLLAEPGDTTPRKAWKWSPSQTKLQSATYSGDGSGWEKVFTMPGVVSWQQAVSENSKLDKAFWDLSHDTDNGLSSLNSHPETGIVMTGILKKNSLLEDEFPNLYAQHKVLPEHVRAAIANLLKKAEKGDPDSKPLLAVLDYKASKGFYAGMQAKGLLDANQPWLPALSKGQTSESDVLNLWPKSAQDGYAKFFQLNNTSQIPEHLQSLINPETVVPTKKLPKWEDLILTPTGKKLGGMHEKEVYVDQEGNEFMAKFFQSDSKVDKNRAAMRIEAETNAVRVGQLYGFNTPPANNQIVHGRYGQPNVSQYAYLQYMVPAWDDFTVHGPSDLKMMHLQQAMSHHVLDRIVANCDTHPQNLMNGKDNKVLGIDLGQAFKHFPNDKLAVGYKPPENGAPVWYDQFYQGVQNGTISKETADEVTKYVLRTAQRVSKDKDVEFRALLEQALVNRDKLKDLGHGVPPWPKQFPTKEKFIEGLLERKHDVFDEFVDFYKGIYAKSPYEFDIDTENLAPPALDPHTHIAVSQDFADDVGKAAAHGKAIFFASADLEDSHILMSTAKDPHGYTILTGEAKVRADGDMVLTNWLKTQTVVNQSGVQHQQVQQVQSAPADATIDIEALPNNAQWINALIQGSKTVSYHNSQGDQNYSTGTLSSMEVAKGEMESMKAKIAKWEETKPDEPFKGLGVVLYSKEQQEHYKAMLDTYLENYHKVINAKGTTNKVTPHFQQVTYTASPEAKAEALKNSGTETKEDWKTQFKDAPEGVLFVPNPGDTSALTYTKTSPKVWTGSDGSLYDNSMFFVKHPDTMDKWEFQDAPVSDDEDEISAEVTVGTKVLKVVYRKSVQQNGTLNYDSGDLELDGTETDQLTDVQGEKLQGHMYEIDFGNTVIEYRPWAKADGVPRSQQGLLRFRRKNWTGDADSINEIFDVLRGMGLEMDTADEESMELFYWEHMRGILNDRKGGRTGKWKQLHDYYKAAETANPHMTRSEQLKTLRAAWALVLGDDVVEKADWMPKFSHLRPNALTGGANSENFTAGRPYWYRADVTVAQLKGLLNGKIPTSTIKHKKDALKMAKSGGGISTEERSRLYGDLAPSGWSSNSDYGTHGSSAQVYMHPRNNPGDEAVNYHPRIWLRTSNYIFGNDFYGEISNKANSASWAIEDMVKQTTEIMVKNAVSVLDDIVALQFQGPNGATDRDAAIKFYKDRGIDTTASGIPIEEVFVTDGNNSLISKNYKKVWEKMLEDEKEGKSP